MDKDGNVQRLPVVQGDGSVRWVYRDYERYAFTPAEFERLWNYRLAIQAGYYTDELRETSG